MKRQLSSEEKGLSIKGIATKEKEITDLKEALRIQKEHYEFYKAKIKHEKATREYYIAQEDAQYKDNLAVLEERIKAGEYTIKTLKDQIKNGVEIKENKSV